MSELSVIKEQRRILRSEAMRFSAALIRSLVAGRSVAGLLRFSGSLSYHQPVSARNVAGTLGFSGIVQQGGFSAYSIVAALGFSGIVTKSVLYHRSTSGELFTTGALDDWISVEELYYGVQNP